jgi:hypothetical protein
LHLASFLPRLNRSFPHRKAQALPVDFMFAMTLFVLLLAYFMVIWDIFLESFDSHSSRVDFELSAITISDQLVSHTGSPENWTGSPENASSIGLASRAGELDPHKLSALSAMPYAYLKQSLGMDRNFFIKVDDLSGVQYAISGQQPGNTTRSVEVTRAAILNNTAVFVRVQVYE